MSIKDQPPPILTSGPPVWELVIRDIGEVAARANRTGERHLLQGETGAKLKAIVLDDIRERDRIGRERYGTPLQTFNGRDALVDAYQECLDALVYLRQMHAELAGERGHMHDGWGKLVCRSFSDALQLVLLVRCAILAREEECGARRPT